jgi:hypothetical protein
MHARQPLALAALCGGLAVAAASLAHAQNTTVCVTCVEPNRTYVCTVRTPDNNPGLGALQLYCIARAAREEGHKTCSVRKQADGRCSGIEKLYTYRGPALPADVRAALDRQAEKQATVPEATPLAPEGRRAPPETLVEMTSRAGSTAGEAVKGVAKGTGTAARETGSRIGSVARGVGKAARNAAGCVWSLFRSCGSGGASDAGATGQP